MEIILILIGAPTHGNAAVPKAGSGNDLPVLGIGYVSIFARPSR